LAAIDSFERVRARRADRPQEISVHVVGARNLRPEVPSAQPILREGVREVVVIGGGLAGLSAAYALRDRDVVVLESEDRPGGLAAQSLDRGITYATGAAYFTKPEGEVLRLYRELGLGEPEEVAIRAPIDSYWRRGVLIKDMWEDGLSALPEEFGAFKDFLETLDDAGLVGVVPFEEQPAKVRMFDAITAAELIEEFGPEVKALIDLYCRSALGTTSDEISAMAFLNFYLDEIGPRYAFPGGTGGIAERLVERISATIDLGARAYDVRHRPDGLVEIRFVHCGRAQAIVAKNAIVTTPLCITARIVRDLEPERAQLFESIEHTSYLVHNVLTPACVFAESYDTWTHDVAFTDVIVGRWQEAKLAHSSVPSEHGVLTVYQPLPRTMWDHTLDDGEVTRESWRIYRDLLKVVPELASQVQVRIESRRWPRSIHIAKPGLITRLGEALRAPHGSVVFATSNLGVPSLEEAIHRGLAAARRVQSQAASSGPYAGIMGLSEESQL
jgi:oxygen-dependent protoporphyrinogen oxidase